MAENRGTSLPVLPLGRYNCKLRTYFNIIGSNPISSNALKISFLNELLYDIDTQTFITNLRKDILFYT